MNKRRNAVLVAFGLAFLICLGLLMLARRSDYTKRDSITGLSPWSSISPTPSTTGPFAGPQTTGDPVTEQQSRFSAAFATPISFFGRVVDQTGASVPLADIKMAANDKALGGKPSEYTLKSDAEGLFSITAIKGLTLAVEVSKPGYRVVPPADGKVTSSGIFDYGLLSTRGRHHPQKEKPVLFTLRKPGQIEPLEKVGKRNFTIQRDGTPLTISLDRTGQHDVVLRCWNSDRLRAEGQRQYDWRFEASVLNGGLVPYKGLDTDAPMDGYVAQDVVEMPSSLPPEQWRRFVERSYFIRFDDQTFARAKLEMRAGGDHFVVWESVFNPKPGSRNLEEPSSPSPR